MGFSNKFSYKGLDLTVLWDWRKGGTIVSRIRALGNTSGVLQETLAGREDGVIGDGVVNTGTVENPQYVPNTTAVPASQFLQQIFSTAATRRVRSIVPPTSNCGRWPCTIIYPVD